LMRAAALLGQWTRARELAEGGPGTEWIGHRAVHEHRLWSWPGAPVLQTLPTPPEADFRFGTLIALFHGAREGRSWVVDGGDVIGSIRNATAGLMGTSPPRSRPRRFFTQLMAELAAITGHHDACFTFVTEAVNEGLLDLAWMNRLKLLDPLRGRPEFEALRTQVAARAQKVVAAWSGPM